MHTDCVKASRNARTSGQNSSADAASWRYIVVIQGSSPDEVLSAALGLGRLHIARLLMTDNEIRLIPDSGQPRSGGRGSLRRNYPGHYRPFHIREWTGVADPGARVGVSKRTEQAPGRLAVFEAVGALLVRIAGRTPAALILDDSHDGDPSTWELVAYLGRIPEAARLQERLSGPDSIPRESRET